jgi:hypothetical protein
MNRLTSTFLTADPTLLTGAGTILNLSGCYYRFNSSRTSAEADAKALFMDWAITGQDLRDAMAAFETETQLTLPFID